MDVSTAKLYDVLVAKGVDKELAQEALREVVTKDELEARLGKGFDGVGLKIEGLRSEMYRAFLIHGLAVVAAVIAAARLL